ncbi:hypothetical protein DERF_004659 [Dermatophagoides farinae]|uniref:Uncharacterized protein n=1 Tax=Dermatophagoides farinae TaxID=6954 RepID=A0A922I2E2_DERFA|nr:hypothetical protein DERF_004659 [Dermatophagoides farinae]
MNEDGQSYKGMLVIQDKDFQSCIIDPHRFNCKYDRIFFVLLFDDCQDYARSRHLPLFLYDSPVR